MAIVGMKRKARSDLSRELPYRFPNGKVYYSLQTACKRVFGELEAPKNPRKRKSSRQENESHPPKRGKTLKKRGRQRTLLSCLLDNNAVSPLAKVYYRDKAGNPLMKGRITRDGIQCDCCFKVFALTAFEAHAGSTLHRPAANIMLDDGSGRSLSDCQRQLRDHDSITKTPAEPVLDKGTTTSYQHDEVCSVCLCESGEFILCDGCPSSIHVNCLGLDQVPDGDWFCSSCCCGICGIGSGDDSAFLTCHQCQLKFHLGCLKTYYSSDSKKLLFCSRSCENIYSGLEKLRGKPIPVGDNLRWTLLKPGGHRSDSKLSVAVDVMHECFEPSTNYYTGRDLVEDVIFSRESKLKRMDCKGFYTVIVDDDDDNDDDVATVATVRIHGNKVAEIPFVATRFRHQRRGMCRALMDELERNLMKMGVEKLVLPALPATVQTWTHNFGFSEMTDEDKSKLFKHSLLDFQGTVLCQKLLKPHSHF